MDYLPSRQTKYGITILYHPYQCRPFIHCEIFHAKVGISWQGWFKDNRFNDIKCDVDLIELLLDFAVLLQCPKNCKESII